MKRFYILTIIFLLAGICSAAAQDLIIKRDGNIIEAKVTEISPAEIRYKRFDHLDGPTIVIPAGEVLSIRYENGASEIITAPPAAAPAQENVQADIQIANTNNTSTNRGRFIFGVNVNGGGAFNYLWDGSSGAGINIELGRGKFISEINLVILKNGFGFLTTFNGYRHNRIGGFYLGGGIGLSISPYEKYKVYGDSWFGRYETKYNASLTIGLNIGHRFVTKPGIYFRTGVFTGFDFGLFWNSDQKLPVYIKPDLAIGWTRR